METFTKYIVTSVVAPTKIEPYLHSCREAVPYCLNHTPHVIALQIYLLECASEALHGWTILVGL